MTRLPRLLLAALCAVPLLLAACEREPSADNLETIQDEAAFIIGYDLGRALHDQMEQVDAQDIFDEQVLLAAVRAGLRGDTLRFSPAAVDSIMRVFQDTLVAVRGRKNRAQADSFLAAVASQDSVETTESGLHYKILAAGSGATPRMGDTVTVNYRGTFADSTEFDSSYRRGRPARFVVGEVIPGWNEALQLMQEGARWQLYIPPDLAYGDEAPPQIGPGRALSFEVELLDVSPNTSNPTAEAPTAPPGQ